MKDIPAMPLLDYIPLLSDIDLKYLTPCKI